MTANFIIRAVKVLKSTNILLVLAALICSVISTADAIRVDSFPSIFKQEQIDSPRKERSASINYQTAQYLLNKPLREESFVFFTTKNEILLSQILNQPDSGENHLNRSLIVNNHTFQINYPSEDPIS